LALSALALALALIHYGLNLGSQQLCRVVQDAAFCVADATLEGALRPKTQRGEDDPLRRWTQAKGRLLLRT